MKYIKYFETVNIPLFEKIDEFEYSILLHKFLGDRFSKFESEKMFSIFEKWKVKKEIHFSISDYSDSGEEYYTNLRKKNPNLNRSFNELYLEYGGRYFGKEITIRKRLDGWFLIKTIPRDAHTFASRNNRTYESYNEYYKCDQFDGLIEFLNEKLQQNEKSV